MTLNGEAGALERLQRGGADIHASLEQLSVRMPRPDHTWMSTLGSVLLLLCGVLAPVQVLLLMVPSISPSLFWTSIAASLVCWIVGHALVVLPELSGRPMHKRLVLTPHTLQWNTHRVSLEQIRTVRLRPHLDHVSIVIATDTEELTFIRDGEHHMLTALRDLIVHHVRRRQHALIAQGHDISRLPTPPRLLEQIRTRS